MSSYSCKEDGLMKNKIQALTETVKELLKLFAEVEKLTIKIVSLVGWILILIKLFQ